MYNMCTDVTVWLVFSKPAETPSEDLDDFYCQLVKRVECRELGSDSAVADDSVIVPVRCHDGQYRIPEDLREGNPRVMLGAFERGVRGSAPYVSIVTGRQAEALQPVAALGLPQPIGSEWHPRSAFLSDELALVELSRLNRTDRLVILRNQIQVQDGLVEIERELLFDESRTVLDLESVPVLPELTGHNQIWLKAATAALARWKCPDEQEDSKSSCAGHYAK